jgi:putative hydrolase of the HAD superfamily
LRAQFQTQAGFYPHILSMGMTSKFGAVLFDYGNVLCPMPQFSDFQELGRVAGIEPVRFIESLWRYRLDYDRGTLDSGAYWHKIGRDSSLEFSDQLIGQLVATDISLWMHPSPILLTWARDLRMGGLKTAILSNMPADHSAYLRSTAPWLEYFDHKVFSGEMGVVKPDAEIYHASLRGLDVQPEKALFIDDNMANVEGARALGIESVRFESIAQLAADVRQFGLPAPFIEGSSSSA